MAAPSKFYMVVPATAASTTDNNRYTTEDEAQLACLKYSLNNPGQQYVVMTSTHYTETPLVIVPATIDAIVVPIP